MDDKLGGAMDSEWSASWIPWTVDDAMDGCQWCGGIGTWSREVAEKLQRCGGLPILCSYNGGCTMDGDGG